jgi:hypothetical protein
MARKMAISSCLRYLLLADAETLSNEGKLRQVQEDGKREIFVRGDWRSPDVESSHSRADAAA